MSVLTHTTNDALHEALRKAISDTPQRVSDVVERVVGEYRVDREEVVAAMWDLVEDDGLVYDAAARIRRA